MRTAEVNLMGKTYTLCYSARVAASVEERSGTVKAEMEKLSEGSLGETFWLLSQLLDAGERYERLMGNEPEPPPSYDDIVDSVGSDEFNEIYAAVARALTAGSTAKVEVKESKKRNAATQGE